jgi:heme exporter protein A
MSSSEALLCAGLVRRYGHRTALDGVDLRVERGETVVLTGANGAGKTTLLRVLATVLRPTSGRVVVEGHALPGAARAARPLVGYAGHEPLVYPALTARENLDLYAALFGVEPDAVPRALDRVGLARRGTDRVSEFSRGMLQRLSLARATLHRPQVLLLDEPSSGLDADGSALLDELLAEQGRTVVIATHDPGRFDAAARRLRIDAGRVSG